MNTYVVYLVESRESIGPFQAIFRNYFRLLEKLPKEELEKLQPLTEIAIVDPNGAVILADMLISTFEKYKNSYERMDGIYIEIIEKNKVFPHRHRGNLEDYVKRRGIPK